MAKFEIDSVTVEGKGTDHRTWLYVIKCNGEETVIKADKSLTLDEIREELNCGVGA